jgi:hypothetical protein
MICPYCKRAINAMTGFQECEKFAKHLSKCRKNPGNLPLSDGRTTVMTPKKYSVFDALEIRADSGQ